MIKKELAAGQLQEIPDKSEVTSFRSNHKRSNRCCKEKLGTTTQTETLV